MTEEARGPGRPAKPKLVKIKLLLGYVPLNIPDERKPSKADWDAGVRPKAAAGSIIEEYEQAARPLINSRVAELVFDDDELLWMTNAEKKAREDRRTREALEHRAAQVYAQKVAARERDRNEF